MSRKVFKWVSDLIRKKPDQTSILPWSAVGYTVIERYHNGRVQNDKLVFTALDKSQLRSKLKTEFGHDPFYSKQLPDERVGIAEHNDNEKLARLPPSHEHILINSPCGTLHLNNQHIELQQAHVPSAGMMCLNSGISQIAHEAIVVVENLAIMQLCHTFTLPPICQQALWIYRGDYNSGAKINTCHDLLNRLGQEKRVIVFSDMDPKGLEIALTTPCANEWLGPTAEVWQDCLDSRLASHSGYDSQANAIKYLMKRSKTGSLSKPLQDLLLLMRTLRSTYRQEHMYVHQIPLSLISL